MEMGEKTLAEALEQGDLNGPVDFEIIQIQLQKGLDTIHRAGYSNNDTKLSNNFT